MSSKADIDADSPVQNMSKNETHGYADLASFMSFMADVDADSPVNHDDVYHNILGQRFMPSMADVDNDSRVNHDDKNNLISSEHLMSSKADVDTDSRVNHDDVNHISSERLMPSRADIDADSPVQNMSKNETRGYADLAENNDSSKLFVLAKADSCFHLAQKLMTSGISVDLGLRRRRVAGPRTCFAAAALAALCLLGIGATRLRGARSTTSGRAVEGAGQKARMLRLVCDLLLVRGGASAACAADGADYTYSETARSTPTTARTTRPSR